MNRSSHQGYSIIKGVLRNSTKFTGKHLCQSLFFKVAGLPVNFVKFLRTPFFVKHLWWLLLVETENESWTNKHCLSL